jgi:hypothetical protein
MDDKRIKITGLEIPFIDLVILMVKLAFASIPAFIIIYFIFALLGVFFNGIFGMFMMHPALSIP